MIHLFSCRKLRDYVEREKSERTRALARAEVNGEGPLTSRGARGSGDRSRRPRVRIIRRDGIFRRGSRFRSRSLAALRNYARCQCSRRVDIARGGGDPLAPPGKLQKGTIAGERRGRVEFSGLSASKITRRVLRELSKRRRNGERETRERERRGTAVRANVALSFFRSAIDERIPKGTRTETSNERRPNSS